MSHQIKSWCRPVVAAPTSSPAPASTWCRSPMRNRDRRHLRPRVFFYGMTDGRCFSSTLPNTPDAGPFTKAESKPDDLLRTVFFQDQLYLMGRQTVEIYGKRRSTPASTNSRSPRSRRAAWPDQQQGRHRIRGGRRPRPVLGGEQLSGGAAQRLSAGAHLDAGRRARHRGNHRQEQDRMHVIPRRHAHLSQGQVAGVVLGVRIPRPRRSGTSARAICR